MSTRSAHHVVARLCQRVRDTVGFVFGVVDQQQRADAATGRAVGVGTRLGMARQKPRHRVQQLFDGRGLFEKRLVVPTTRLVLRRADPRSL